MSPNQPVVEADRLLELHFDDNDLLSALVGPQDRNLSRIEHAFAVDISHVGNILNIMGTSHSTKLAQQSIDALRDRLKNGLDVTTADVDAAIRISDAKVDDDTKDRAMTAFSSKPQKIVTKRKHISPRSPTQAAYLETIDKHDMVFGVGPAGTGKTYLAVAKGVEKLLNGDVERLVVTRPAVEAGERLGFLPGDMQEKIDPYLRPVYDALYDMMPQDHVVRMMAQGQIEIAPLAFMRGRTLNHAFVVLDEAQNTTSMQMKMFLTRLGENGQMVINGDISQTDLPRGEMSGLAQAVDLLKDDKDIAVIRFKVDDVVRHPLVGRIIKAYDRQKT